MVNSDWFKNAIVYQILIDRFAGYTSNGWNEPEFIGGNIQGITGRLDYLSDLGVTCLWLSPFCKTSAYHGYHITDFYQIDSRFGTEDDLKNLVAEAHRRGISIIMDFVPNHCSSQHPFFLEARKNPNSEYKDWFIWKNWPDDYVTFLSINQLPKLNLDYYPCKRHIIDAARKWLDLGIDGFRLDHVPGPKHSFWQDFYMEIKESYPYAVLIGEAWLWSVKYKELHTINTQKKLIKWLLGAGSADNLQKEYFGEMDGVLDFKFLEIIRKFGSMSMSLESADRAVVKHLEGYLKNYTNFILPLFLDNHDVDRFLFVCNQDTERLKQAAHLQFSFHQPVIIYYGTEIGMTQKSSMLAYKEHGDLQARQPMVWEPEKQDKELLRFYKDLIRAKKGRSKPAIPLADQ